MTRTLLAAALFAACLTAWAQIQPKDKDKDKEAQKPTEPTQDFVTKAIESAHAEVDHGRLAAKQANDKEVRKFAQQMVDDHNKLTKELTDLLSKKRLELPTSSDAEHDRIRRRLETLKGAPFDRSYLERRVGDQRAVVGMFERQARDGRDDAVKSWAKKKLPELRANLREAERLQRRVGGSERVTDKSKNP